MEFGFSGAKLTSVLLSASVLTSMDAYFGVFVF